VEVFDLTVTGAIRDVEFRLGTLKKGFSSGSRRESYPGKKSALA